ncbi:MAG: DUF4430 domain-containing protein, partial [Oscillospiraceae bacterium]
KNNNFGKFFGYAFLSSTTKNTFYLQSISITGLGTEKAQGTYVTGKTSADLKTSAATLGGVWTAQEGVNSGYPYLLNLPLPTNTQDPVRPMKLVPPSGLVWSGSILKWDEVYNATSYTAYLYKQSKQQPQLLNTITDIAQASYDFAPHISTTESGVYYVLLQAEGNGAEYLTSSYSAQSPSYAYLAKDPDGYVRISTAEELLTLADKSTNLAVNYRLVNDIDMAGYTAKTIGSNAESPKRPFTGIFDGGGHTITNLNLAGEALFGFVDSTGSIKNLTLNNAAIECTTNSSSMYPAALVSYNKGNITSCFVVNSRVLSQYNSVTGGVVGLNEGTIAYSGMDGGVVSYKGTGTKTGGFVGRNLGSIDQCFSSAAVSGYKWVGGFAGAQEGGSITNSYATGSVTATGEAAGGFAGCFIHYYSSSSSLLQNIYAANDVSGLTGGPLIGGKSSYDGLGSIENAYFNSDKKAPETVGIEVTNGITPTTGSDMKSDAFTALLGTSAIWARQAVPANGTIKNEGYPYLVQAPPVEQAPQLTTITVQLMIAPYNRSSYSFTPTTPVTLQLNGETETGGKTTVKDLLDAAVSAGHITYEAANDSVNGYYVTAINGVAPKQPDGWMFTINDALSSVGMRSATIKDGDKILWFEGAASAFYKAPLWNDLIGPAYLEYTEIATAEELLALATTPTPAIDWAKN